MARRGRRIVSLAFALALGALALGALAVGALPSAREALLDLAPVQAAAGWYHRLRDRIADARYASCLKRLDGHGAVYSEVDDQPPNDVGCEIAHAVRVDHIGGARLGRPATMTCALADRLGEWVREQVQPAADELLGGTVARIEHVGTYACRTVAGRSSLSRHAFANAIDVSGVTLADGRRVTVAGAWPDAGSRGDFMRRVGRGASSAFCLALTPDDDARHGNHFHLDAGPYFFCGF